MKFINYAHRGASEYAPENTMLSFNLGIFMGANGIETDVQLTKDGVPVLFHDQTLERVTDLKDNLSDLNLSQLQEVLVLKNEFADKIVTLEDFLKAFGWRDLTFAIELKGDNTAQKTAELLKKYHLEKKAIATSFKYNELVEFKKFAPEFEAGYLAFSVDRELLDKMKADGIMQICPEAKIITKDLCEQWHSLGFNVRAWGVVNEELMKNCVDAGVDGMTVNFPDKLTQLLRNK